MQDIAKLIQQFADAFRMKKYQYKGFWIIALLFTSTLLVACGQKGPLRHPEPEARQINSQG